MGCLKSSSYFCSIQQLMEKHTYDYGLIGNCAFLALVGKDTNVGWMCLPRFDSSPVFGGLVGGEKGGEFSVKPEADKYDCRQEYITNTNILTTEITTAEGSYRVTDTAPRFMQNDRYYRPLMLIRKIEPLRGNPRVRAVCQPVSNYGEKPLEMERGSNHIRYNGLEENLRLTTNIPLSYLLEGKGFVLSETCYMILSYGVPLEGPLRETTQIFEDRTRNYWQRWVKSTSIGSNYQNAVIRSALTLKICQYEDTGAIIASPTTSLPESPGSTRNWDYRYCWMRDTYYTLNAFNNIGHFEEMERYFSYLMNIPMPNGKRIQPLYGIGGEAILTELELDLPGYLGNKPVRRHPGADTELVVRAVLDKIEMTIDEADAGIWEFRNQAHKHAYTNLFQWAGCHAAMKIARRLDSKPLVEKARSLSQKAADYIDQCYLEDRRAFAQGVGNTHLDASTLQLIIMGYIPHDSQRAADHLKALEEDLRAGKGLFYRYLQEDDFGKPESTFLICGFWYAEALACVGRVDDAMEAFEDLSSRANHLGLLSEDVDEKSGSMWGNFPQAYSHVGLVNAAARINSRLNRPGFLNVD
ncbi:MAG: glycoside hydrolase family 15 protein [Flavobacteriales bacterium]|nr:glycoside hydrolase family 15 protein [Flavobacteriales bacterium]